MFIFYTKIMFIFSTKIMFIFSEYRILSSFLMSLYNTHVIYGNISSRVQLRMGSSMGTASNLFLMGQSLYLISQLLSNELLHINELDPIRRYMPSYNRPRKGGRYSAFQVTNRRYMASYNRSRKGGGGRQVLCL